MPATSSPPLPIDPRVWKAIAGASARAPYPGSLVYYFPQGHAEHCSSPPNLSDFLSQRSPSALCRVSTLTLHADSITDEPFARIVLDPRGFASSSSSSSRYSTYPADRGEVASFAKVLTPSDANNGGGFSVPRFCADSVLPRLDLAAADTPAQILSVRDVHGRVWAFRHIYRGTPRRHLLTTGWSKFVNSKKLVAGDSVVFVRNRGGEIFIGIRRAYTSSYLTIPSDEKQLAQGAGFSRGTRGRVPPETVVEAVRLMGLGQPFEVMYYPRAGSAEFLVADEVVEAALSVRWQQGMRVQMAIEADDTTRMARVLGTVSGAAVPDGGLWPQSPWRMLQVKWDDPEVMHDIRSVSPWQVELVSATTYLQTSHPVMNKFRVSESPELLIDTDLGLFSPVKGFNSMKTGALTPLLSDYNTFPAGMQGARHDMHLSSVSNFVPRTNYEMFSEDLYGINMPKLKKLKRETMECSIGSASQSRGSSPLSQESIRDNGTKPLSATAYTPARKSSEVSFQLFGQIIHTKQPVGDHVEKKDVLRPLDFALTYQHKQLLDGLDVHG